MRYWWVNQNQRFWQEIDGGYLWSPKRNANGADAPRISLGSVLHIAPHILKEADLIMSCLD